MHAAPIQSKPKSEPTDPAAEPDVLVMTATPIPRTLALTLYGDLDVSVIDEMPPGRTPIVTRRVADDRAPEVWDFVRKQAAAGTSDLHRLPGHRRERRDASSKPPSKCTKN